MFCFRHADRRTKERWAFKPDADNAPSLFDVICDLTRSKWSELEAQRTGGKSNRHRKHHDQPITSLVAEAQEDIRRARLDETFGEDIFRFRISGEKRLWGFRSGRVFHVVWWDPDHRVYPTEPN